LKVEQLRLGPRSGRVQVWGKGNKYREVPLNDRVRRALEEYLVLSAQDLQTAVETIAWK
jgi:integrase/recombinase XerC